MILKGGIKMSYNDDEIYNSMDSFKDEKKYRGGNNVAGKIAGSILFLSIGFMVGNIGKVAVNNNETQKEVKATSFLTQVSNVPAQAKNNGEYLTIKEIAEKNLDSIVEIQTESKKSSSFFGTYTTIGAGSGIIISQDGYIITNNHVIDNSTEINVILHNGKEYKAELIGTDSKADIAVLKINEKNLTPVVVGDSDALSVGDTAVVIGNPLGKLGGTVTDGIISALERELVLEDGEKRTLIQTNAAINGGNSGGGLFNSNGELVGIVEAKSSGLDVEGLGFAIPVNNVKDIINDILNLGYVSGRPYLGVALADSKKVTNSVPDSTWGFFFGDSYSQISYGAYVKEVVKGSAAEEAGIKEGDQIISINDNVVSSSSDVTTAISNYKVGDKISVGLIRDNKMIKVDATLKEYKGEKISQTEDSKKDESNKEDSKEESEEKE